MRRRPEQAKDVGQYDDNKREDGGGSLLLLLLLLLLAAPHVCIVRGSVVATSSRSIVWTMK